MQFSSPIECLRVVLSEEAYWAFRLLHDLPEPSRLKALEWKERASAQLPSRVSEVVRSLASRASLQHSEGGETWVRFSFAEGAIRVNSEPSEEETETFSVSIVGGLADASTLADASREFLSLLPKVKRIDLHPNGERPAILPIRRDY